MHHKIVQTVLEYGYGETFGEDVVAETFQNFLMSRDRNESQVTATDVNISDFLDFFLQQHEGAVLGDTDDEDDPEPQGLISYFNSCASNTGLHPSIALLLLQLVMTLPDLCRMATAKGFR